MARSVAGRSVADREVYLAEAAAAAAKLELRKVAEAVEVVKRVAVVVAMVATAAVGPVEEDSAVVAKVAPWRGNRHRPDQVLGPAGRRAH